MDIEILEKQVRELQEWKTRVSPMLEAMMPDFERYRRGEAKDEGDEESEEDEKARIVREADEIRANDKKREADEKRHAEVMSGKAAPQGGGQPTPNTEDNPQGLRPQTGDPLLGAAGGVTDDGNGPPTPLGGGAVAHTTDKTPPVPPNPHGTTAPAAAPGGTTERQPGPLHADPAVEEAGRRREEALKERREDYAEQTGVRSKEGMPIHEGIAGQEPKHDNPPGNTTERNPPANPSQK